jgi:hypothetical protein
MDNVSTTNQLVQSIIDRPIATPRRLVGILLGLAAGEAALTIGHFVYGAELYDDPSRLHVVGPAIAFLVIAGALGVLYLWRPRWWTLALFALELVAVDIGLLGIYHGAFNHAVKDILYHVGVGAERLQQIFDSPDFTVPNDVVYEVTGLLTAVFATYVGIYLVRLVRASRKAK